MTVHNIGIFRRCGNTLCLSLVFLSAWSSAQFHAGDEHLSARVCALGGCGASTRIPGWSAAVNPAGLADSGRLTVIAGVRPTLYGLPELRRVAVGISWSRDESGYGCTIVSEGSPLFHVEGGAIAAAASIARTVSLGLGVCGEQMSFDRYGSVRSWMLTVGILIAAGEALDVGTVLENPTRNWIVRRWERAPTRLRSDATYRPTDSVTMVAGLTLEEHLPPTIGAGAEWTVAECLVIRFGLTTDPDIISAGMDLRTGAFVLGAAAWAHPDLGWSEQLEIAFSMPMRDGSE